MSKEMLYQRDVYGKTLVELGKKNPQIVVLDADLSGSTRTALFGKEFPDRFFNFGVAEQNMMAAASGMASCGKIVFASTFAMFATGRAWDQIRNSIAYSNLNVKIVATHAGITVGPDGATHQALEDMTLMRVIPNMKVIVPCDGPQTRAAVIAAAEMPGPVYIRLGRAKFPTIDIKEKFEIGKADILTEGKDATIFACGVMVNNALEAERNLRAAGIKCAVINMHTVKPIDKKTIGAFMKTKAPFYICEEHTTIGGLGSAVEEVVAHAGTNCKVRRIAVDDQFGQSGEPDELLKLYRLTAADIAQIIKKDLKKYKG
ncbi:MAG: transketolase family protein [Candidatus Omnitrophica bacterium]|nr:transketolase family protein [Candidatus Omnitrophota bacterium]MBU1924671.1 transketolase family protein [Candidatus Omnitrophota bacterium]